MELFFFRVSSCSTDLFLPLEHFIRSVFLPSLLGRTVPGDVERKLFTLPVQLGGLDVFDPSIVLSQQRSYSVEVNAGLVGLIISHVHQLGDCLDAQFQLRSKFYSRSHQEQLQFANHLFDELPPSMCSSVKLAQEKGASNWLSCLPLKSHDFVLHKTAFRDAIALCYH